MNTNRSKLKAQEIELENKIRELNELRWESSDDDVTYKLSQEITGLNIVLGQVRMDLYTRRRSENV